MLSSGQIETLTIAADTYHKQLIDYSDETAVTGHLGAIEYLQKRKIFGGLAEYQLGVVADPLPGDEQYSGRLAIPYLTPAGVRGIKYRCIADHDCKTVKHAKYTQPEGQEQRLYNVAAYHTSGNVLGVAEGEIDALTATVHLGLPTLGVPGASQWKANGKYWKLALADFALIVIFVDGDKPRCMCQPRCRDECGQPKRAGLELAKQIQADAGNARLVQLPDGEDVNSMVVAGRVDELKRKAGLT
jgi:hypothetical protein